MSLELWSYIMPHMGETMLLAGFVAADTIELPTLEISHLIAAVVN